MLIINYKTLIIPHSICKDAALNNSKIYLMNYVIILTAIDPYIKDPKTSELLDPTAIKAYVAAI